MELDKDDDFSELREQCARELPLLLHWFATVLGKSKEIERLGPRGWVRQGIILGQGETFPSRVCRSLQRTNGWRWVLVLETIYHFEGTPRTSQ